MYVCKRDIIVIIMIISSAQDIFHRHRRVIIIIIIAVRFRFVLRLPAHHPSVLRRVPVPILLRIYMKTTRFRWASDVRILAREKSMFFDLLTLKNTKIIAN